MFREEGVPVEREAKTGWRGPQLWLGIGARKSWIRVGDIEEDEPVDY